MLCCSYAPVSGTHWHPGRHIVDVYLGKTVVIDLPGSAGSSAGRHGGRHVDPNIALQADPRQ
jgi:hypothetical protein